MIPPDEVAVLAGERGRSDRAVGSREDRWASIGGEVEPWWNPGSPLNGSERPPKVPVSQPARTDRRRAPANASHARRHGHIAQPAFEAMEQSRSTPKVLSGDEMAAAAISAIADAPPDARAFTTAASFCIARTAG